MARESIFTEEQLVSMKNAYTLGSASLRSLAKEYGVSVPTIAKYLRKSGVSVRARGRPVTNVPETVTTVDPNAFDNVFNEDE